MRRKILGLLLAFLFLSCTTTYKNQTPLGQTFPSVKGTSLEGSKWTIPEQFRPLPTVLLIGFKQESQFDIDRWLIGLDMRKVNLAIYELPVIMGLFPRMISKKIDNGMRAGIPRPLWKNIITIYKDSEKIQTFLGNERPNNARVILLDAKSTIRFFHDKGFSVLELNHLIKTIDALAEFKK